MTILSGSEVRMSAEAQQSENVASTGSRMAQAEHDFMLGTRLNGAQRFAEAIEPLKRAYGILETPVEPLEVKQFIASCLERDESTMTQT